MAKVEFFNILTFSSRTLTIPSTFSQFLPPPSILLPVRPSTKPPSPYPTPVARTRLAISPHRPSGRLSPLSRAPSPLYAFIPTQTPPLSSLELPSCLLGLWCMRKRHASLSSPYSNQTMGGWSSKGSSEQARKKLATAKGDAAAAGVAAFDPLQVSTVEEIH